jgi:hypothetical protein
MDLTFFFISEGGPPEWLKEFYLQNQSGPDRGLWTNPAFGLTKILLFLASPHVAWAHACVEYLFLESGMDFKA